MRIGTDFPGGNVAVRSLEEKRALLSPELRDTEGYWFYWCFEAGFDVPGDYEFEFDGIAVGACGPAVSEDGGRSWRRLGSGGCTDYRFVYRAERPGRVRFSSGMQYLQSDLERFLSEVPEVTRSVLCRSRKGREVELLRLGAADAARKVLLTSRHHCCEAMATHVLEGMLRAAAATPELLTNMRFRSWTRTARRRAIRARTACRATTRRIIAAALRFIPKRRRSCVWSGRKGRALCLICTVPG